MHKGYLLVGGLCLLSNHRDIGKGHDAAPYRRGTMNIAKRKLSPGFTESFNDEPNIRVAAPTYITDLLPARRLCSTVS